MKTRLCKTFKLGTDTKITQRGSGVYLSFFIEGEEIELEFKKKHTHQLNKIVEKLQGARSRNNIKPRRLPKKETEKFIIAVDF